MPVETEITPLQSDNLQLLKQRVRLAEGSDSSRFAFCLWGRVGVIKVMGGLRDALASECIHVFRNRPHGYKLGALLDKLD